MTVVASLVALAVMVLAPRGWLTREDGRFLDTETLAQQGLPAAPSSAPSAARAGAAQPATAGVWWSGVGASDAVGVNGTWERWRGETVSMAGVWDNGNAQMVEMHSICAGGLWARWNKPLDLAIGAIEGRKGETWAKAARGAYDARWRANLQRIKSCWAPRDPALLYIRFAHEMNLKDMPWQVRGGEEADFAAALTRYSTLRYQILPRANLVLCPSDGTSAGMGIDLRKLWPGRDAAGRQVVQVYAVDSYNSWVVTRSAAEFAAKLTADQNGQPLGLEKHRLLAQEWGVPFAVAEWAGNGDPRDEGTGADLPIYYQLMNEWFRTNAADPWHPKPGQLLYELYFNEQDRFTLLPTKFQPRSAQQYRSLIWGR